MFLWPNKESIHVKQASDIINSIFGLFQNNLCFTGCPKKFDIQPFFEPKICNTPKIELVTSDTYFT